MSRTRRGVTLTEVLIASAITVVVILGLSLLDAARLRMGEELKARSGLTSGHAQAAVASFHLARELARADRFFIRDSGLAGVNPGGTPPNQGKVQLRFNEACASPGEPSCFDTAANYRWDEYRISGGHLDGGHLEHFKDTQANCAKKRLLATQVASLTFRFRDEAPAPPGDPPFATPEDNNALEYSILWDNGLSGPDHRTHELHGLVESRAIAYSDVPGSDLNAAKGDSGTGVDATGVLGVSVPPAVCP